MPTATRVEVELADLHPGQWQVLDEARRFNVVNCGRRWGKSTLGIDLVSDTALDGFPAAYYEPTYKMLSDVWRELVRQFPPPLGKTSAQEHRLDLITGGHIQLWSLDNPDSSRGFAYKRAVIDEAAMVPLLCETFQKVIRPTLTDFAGDAWFFSTPRGFNDFYTLHAWGRERDEWMSWTRPSSDNPHLPAEEIEAARRDMDPRLFGQEYLADFLSDARAVFIEGLVLDPTLVPIPRALRGETDWGALLPPSAICYRAPTPYGTYVLGADVAQGLAHGDASAAVVFDLETGEEVAHLHERVPPDEFADHLHLLGNAYPGVLGVERNNHGFAVIQRMRELHGARYLLCRDLPPLATSTDFEVPSRAGDYGWLTTARSKPLMIAELEEAVRKGLLRFGTPELVQEMRHYQRQDNGDTSAPAGMFDDRVVAAAIAWQMRKRIVEADDRPRRVRLEGLFS